MGDEAIQEQIRAAFQEMYEGRGRARERGRTNGRRNRSLSNEHSVKRKNFRLQFTIAGKVFSTVLKVKSELISIYNGVLPAKLFTVRTKSLKEGQECITISIIIPPMGVDLEQYIENEMHEFDSMISANDPSNKCFDPVLVPNRTNPNESLRFSSADVLQTLKTKLQYLLPNPHHLPITIHDAATTKSVALTPFHIMRGGNPFYFKYGFQYRNLRPLQDILPRINWGSLRLKPYFEAITFEERIFQITGKRYEDDTIILRLLQDIPFELESRTNEGFILEKRQHTIKNLYNELSLSLSLLRVIAKEHGFTDDQVSELGGDDNIFTAIHDPASPEWIASSRRLLLTNFTEVAEGGKRKTRRRKKRSA
jgi:hypothetical protein